jgi:hypothetical protein
MPSLIREQKRFETRKLTEKYYCWDIIAKKWEKYLDNLNLTGLQGKWDIILPKIPNIESKDIVSNDTPHNAIMKIISQKLSNHQITSSMILLNMISDLTYGFIINGLQTQPYNIDQSVSTINNLISNHNMAMEALANKDRLGREDFIDYAIMKDSVK